MTEFEINSVFSCVVQALEALSIMPKEMPGIEKINRALASTAWFKKIDPKKVIVVAGTNGKGSTCAILEALLVTAGKNVGFYSSPHLIDTTERIRFNQKQISRTDFIQLYKANQERIQKFELTHFEALTLMAADYFFSGNWQSEIDFALFEVGLGGTFDATNAIPHATSVITSLSLDHTNILGKDLISIAGNKFGIIKNNNEVVHHRLPAELDHLKEEWQKKTASVWTEAVPVKVRKESGPIYYLETPWGETEMNLLGPRAGENAATALTVFQKLGFDPPHFLEALKRVNWQGRMQKVFWPHLKAPLYLSGDHNAQGVDSLIEILKDFTWENLYVVIGIGKDKDAAMMLQKILKLSNLKLYLTETPFKGFAIEDYPDAIKNVARMANAKVAPLLEAIKENATARDLVIVTGSLYLVGDVLKEIERF